MLVTQGQSLQLRADGQVEADVVITTDSLLTLHLIQRRDSVLASFIIEKFCERGIEVGTIFEFPDSNYSHNKISASCSNMVKNGSVPFFHKRLTRVYEDGGLVWGFENDACNCLMDLRASSTIRIFSGQGKSLRVFCQWACFSNTLWMLFTEKSGFKALPFLC
jgi:hypothetical protein